jgi:ketosteroid isomerase-like protein
MSAAHDNLALWRVLVHALNRGDVDEVVRLSTDDVVIIAARSDVEGPFVGHEGARKFFADNEENFELFQIRLDEVRVLDKDRVLGIGTVHVRGRGGGVETDAPIAGIATFRDGRLSRWEDFRDRRRAFEAAGVSE